MISLRNYRPSDVDRLSEIANNREVSRYLAPSFPFPYTIEAARWWLETGVNTEGLSAKVIEFDGLFVGAVGTQAKAGWMSHTAEIGYWIDQAHWGRGIATAALAAMTELAFSELGYSKLQAQVLLPNDSSVRVLQKCDYFLEAELRREVYKEGQFFDVQQFARFDE
ncbi:MAG: N-acetyltransferase [Pseudohongiella sp.]|nr:MAG: N-acetyltransferase [Pseudohongiella sp.]